MPLLSTEEQQHNNHSIYQRQESHQNRANAICVEDQMRKEYDFSKGKKNPYAKQLKKQITIRIEEPTIDYFKELAEEVGVPYQTLINLYLRDCAQSERKLKVQWK
jgi:uncharacterized protein (DUF4415 family)